MQSQHFCIILHLSRYFSGQMSEIKKKAPYTEKRQKVQNEKLYRYKAKGLIISCF